MVKSDKSEAKWKYSEHTKVKHEIFSKYFKTWSNILGKDHNLHVFDCFAGKGRYVEGNQGSPLKILRILKKLKAGQGKPENAFCHFIEKNESNYENLCVEVQNFEEVNSNLDWLEINCYHGEFSNIIEEILQKFDDKISPAFFFIDPFGFGGIPLHILTKILSFPKTEIFITFMTRDVNRFISSPPHKTSISELFGCEDVVNIIENEPYFSLTREQALLKFYRHQIHESGIQFTFPFQVKADNNLQTVYYLIHCTNHPKGCEIMKEIMYNTGTEGKFGYLGPAQGQLSLDYFYGGPKNLKEFLYEKYENKSLGFKKIRYDNLMETPYIKKHYREALLILERENRIEIIGKGKRNGFNEQTKIIFKKPKNLLSFCS